MKKILIFLIILILFFRCVNSTTGKQEDSTSRTLIKTDTITTNKGVIDGYINNSIESNYQFEADTTISDTINIKEYRLLIQSISKDSFINTIKENHIKSYHPIENGKIQRINDLAERISDSTILIRLKNGNRDTIFNDKYSRHFYIDYIKEIHSHLIKVYGMDCASVIAVNDSTGIKKDLYLLSHVAIDKNKERLITYQWDGFTFESGGYKLFDISQDEWVELFAYYPNNLDKYGYEWSLSDVYFLNKNELFCLYQFYQRGVTIPRKCFVKMTIETNASN